MFVSSFFLRFSKDDIIGKVSLNKEDIIAPIRGKDLKYKFAYLSVSSSVCLSVCLSVCPSVRLSVCLSVCMSFCSFVCLSVKILLIRIVTHLF